VKTGQIPAATVQRFATIPLRFSPATLRLQLLLVTRRTGTPKTTRCKKNFMKKITAGVQGGCHGAGFGLDVGLDVGVNVGVDFRVDLGVDSRVDSGRAR
jgi:hypothetical protein